MDNTETVKEKVSSAINKYSMLCGVKNIVAGFSGGADSSAMLFLLSEICKKNGIILHAVHVNHGIRGEEAERDANFCALFCQKYNIELTVKKVDIPSLSKERGTGLEETARNERYRILESEAAKYPDTKTATAHNADDNLETLIFNISRGSGTKGLCGIPAVRDGIIRPLILCTKDEIKGFCAENGLDYVFDSTNNDTDYTRNYIRHNIIPCLRHINPSVSDAGARLCSTASRDCSFIDEYAKKYENEDGIKELALLHNAVLSRVICRKYKAAGGNTLELVHIEAVSELIRGGTEGSKISLPGKISAEIRGGKLGFSGYRENDTHIEYKAEISCGALSKLPYGEIYAFFGLSEEIPEGIKNIYNLYTQVTFDSAKIHGMLYARERIYGDTVKCGGMTKKVKKLFNAAKLSKDERELIPVICDEDGILWIPGIAVRDSTKYKDKSSEGKPLTVIYLRNKK